MQVKISLGKGKQPVEAKQAIVPGLAITRHAVNKKEWSVIHIPSGKAIAQGFKRLSDARGFILELSESLPAVSWTDSATKILKRAAWERRKQQRILITLRDKYGAR